MDCPKCKCHIEQEDARFCGNCGTLLRRDTYSEEPQNQKGADSNGESAAEETEVLHDSGDQSAGKETSSSAPSETEAPIVSGWQQEGEKWYYYDEQGTMLTDTWVENYYVGADGVMMTNALTPDGYWLGEDGLASEDRRIYGNCLFAPVSYAIEGDKVLITGTLCDSLCAPREVIDSLQVGDLIIRPSDGFSGRVCAFDTESAITDITYYDYLEEGTNKPDKNRFCLYRGKY